MSSKLCFNKLRGPFIPAILLGLIVLSLMAGCTTGGNEEPEKPQDGKVVFTVPEDNFPRENLQGSTLEERFDYEDSLYRVEQVREALTSFRELTEASQGKIAAEQLEKIGYTGWEMQNLGFSNIPNTLEGVLRYQDYQIKKLAFALAIERYEADEIPREEVEEREQVYQEAKEDFSEFLQAYIIAD